MRVRHIQYCFECAPVVGSLVGSPEVVEDRVLSNICFSIYTRFRIRITAQPNVQEVEGAAPRTRTHHTQTTSLIVKGKASGDCAHLGVGIRSSRAVIEGLVPKAPRGHPEGLAIVLAYGRLEYELVSRVLPHHLCAVGSGEGEREVASTRAADCASAWCVCSPLTLLWHSSEMSLAVDWHISSSNSKVKRLRVMASVGV